MSAADVHVRWYADDRRASVVDGSGTKWWVAPNDEFGYSAICDETGGVHSGSTLGQVLEAVLGDQWRLFLSAGVS